MRRLRPGEGAAAAGLFALLATFLLRDALLGGGVLSSATTLYANTPFAGVAPSGWQANSNLVIADSPYYFTPLFEFARDRLHNGELPFWNPLILGGAPLLGDYQSAVLSPLNLPVWLLPFSTGLAVTAWLKLWIASLGAYALCRRLGVGFWAGVCGGLGYGFGAFTLVWLSHGHTYVSVFLPWVLVLVEALSARPRVGTAVGLALVLAAALLGGHPESAIYLVLAAVLWMAVRLAQGSYGRREKVRRAALFAGAVVLGVGLAAVALLPFLAQLPGSVDQSVRTTGPVAPGKGLLTVAFPDWWGRPSHGVVGGPANYNERTLYAGVLLLAFLPVALFHSARRLAPVVAIGLLGLLGSTDATWLSEVLGQAPFLRQTTLGRLGNLLVLAVAVTGALGVDRVLREGLGRSGGARALATGAVLALLALVLASPSLAHLRDGLVGLAGGGAGTGTLETLRSEAVLRCLALLAAAAAALALMWSGRLPARAAGPALAVLVALDMMAFAGGYHPVIPESQFYRPVPGSVRFLAERQGSGRVAATYSALPSNTNMVFGLRDLRGLEHPTPDRQFAYWQATLNPQQVGLQALALDPRAPASGQALSMMAVGHVLTPPNEGPPSSGSFRRVYRGPDADVWRNRSALPRAYVPRQAAEPTSPGDAYRTVTAPTFSAEALATLEGVGKKSSRGVRGRTAIVSDRPEEVVIDATLDRPGAVVLADTSAKGWSVEVDGRQAPALTANYVVRGVAVGAGRHRIRWSYTAPGFRSGALVSSLSLLVVVLLLVAVAIGRWRAARPR